MSRMIRKSEYLLLSFIFIIAVLPVDQGEKAACLW